MRILHLTNHYFPCIGGIERVVLDFCNVLARQGHECRVVCLNKCAGSSEKLPLNQKINGIRVRRIPFLDLKCYKVTLPFLRHFRAADIIHVHGLGFFSDFALLTKFLHKKPVVISSHGAIFHTGSNFFKDLYFFGWNRLLLKLADRIIAVSEPDRGVFSRIVPAEKIELVENPLDLEKFKPGRKEKNSFLFVGRLSRNKRIDLLLEAFAFLGKNDFKLRIVGKDFDSILPELKRIADEKGVEERVEFLGAVSERELLKLYSKSDFFVSASEYEGFGISAVEAMASGCIPLLSGIGSFRKFIKGGNGFLVDYNNSENASGKILKAIRLPQRERERIRSKAVKGTKKYSLESRLKKLVRVYEKAIG